MGQAPPPFSIARVENEKATLPPAETSPQPNTEPSGAAKKARLEELRRLCAEEMELLKQLKPNEFQVDAKALKEFKKNAYLWKAGANVGSPGQHGGIF